MINNTVIIIQYVIKSHILFFLVEELKWIKRRWVGLLRNLEKNKI